MLNKSLLFLNTSSIFNPKTIKFLPVSLVERVSKSRNWRQASSTNGCDVEKTILSPMSSCVSRLLRKKISHVVIAAATDAAAAEEEEAPWKRKKPWKAEN